MTGNSYQQQPYFFKKVSEIKTKHRFAESLILSGSVETGR